jgi:broad-specificity NMP kinase
MKIILSGLPATGKTTLSNYINKNLRLNFNILNDKSFAINNNCGDYKKIYNKEEYIVDITKLNKKINYYLKDNKKKNIILEGHLWCELSKALLKKFDFVFILKTSKNQLLNRYKKRGYSELKILDNIFCYENNYIENILKSKKIDYKVININKNLKSNLEKINKYLKL